MPQDVLGLRRDQLRRFQHFGRTEAYLRLECLSRLLVREPIEEPPVEDRSSIFEAPLTAASVVRPS